MLDTFCVPVRKRMHSPGLIVERKNVTFLRLLSGLAVGVVDKNCDAAHVDKAKPLAE